MIRLLLLLLLLNFIRSLQLNMSSFTSRLPIDKGLLPIPNGMKSNIQGTWAYDTMSRRVITDIIPRIIDDNSIELTKPTSSLRSECLLQLNDLIESLKCGKSGYLRGIADSGPDLKIWDNILNSIPSDDRNWLDAPWVISEFYLYRRIAEAFRFFETGYDPFIKQKFDGLVAALPSVDSIAERLPNLINEGNTGDISIALEIAVQTSLWGNKMDLSLWPASKKESIVQSSGANDDVSEAGKISYGAALDLLKPYILDDHTARVVELLKNSKISNSNSNRRIDIVVDNAGYELISDMLLGHILIELGVATSVTFHTKGHPTFVSDATNEDCLGTIDFLKESTNPATKALANQLDSHVINNRFVFTQDLFWCQPTAFWDMPDHIVERIKDSVCIFVKGDANYRRLLGEREWDLNTNAADILSYWPAPCCALRTFKAEIGCGISNDKQEYAKSKDKQWMVSGKWGVVQLSKS